MVKVLVGFSSSNFNKRRSNMFFLDSRKQKANQSFLYQFKKKRNKNSQEKQNQLAFVSLRFTPIASARWWHWHGRCLPGGMHLEVGAHRGAESSFRGEWLVGMAGWVGFSSNETAKKKGLGDLKTSLEIVKNVFCLMETFWFSFFSVPLPLISILNC